MRKFPAVKAGQWVQPNPQRYRMMCCDCGLIHTLQFRTVRYARGRRRLVQFRAWRGSPKTPRIRTVVDNRPE